MKRKYKGKYIQRERRIYHGDYLDVNIFPVFKKPGKRKKQSIIRNTEKVKSNLQRK